MKKIWAAFRQFTGAIWSDAMLAACDAEGGELARVRVPAGFKLSLASASAWIEGGFRKPA